MRRTLGFAVALSALGVLAARPPAARADDVVVRAEVDRDRIGLDDQILLDVVVEGRFRGGAPPQAPPLDDFEVYSRGTSQSMQIVNGDVSTSLTYTYLLVPKREGILSIGSFLVRVGGKEHKTQPITITVGGTGGGQRGAPGNLGAGGASGTPGQGGAPGAPGHGAGPGRGAAPEDAGDDGESRDLFVVARVDRQSAYVNEQILYTFYLYRAERAAQITNVNYAPPSFQGFWMEKLKDSEKQSYKVLNGRRYVVTELSTALFPTTSGTLTIEPARLQLTLLQNTFGFPSFFDRGVDRVLRTRPVTIEVQALPAAGKPAIFDGAVGEGLRLTARLDRTEVEEGEPATLTMRVEGEGNVKTFSKPRLPELLQFKVYDSNSKTDVQATDRVSGSRTYEIVLVPKDEGEHDIQPIRLAYFDTREGRYRVLETKPLHLTAVRSSHPDRAADAAGPPRQQDIQILGSDIAHIHTDVPVSDTLTPLYRRGLVAALLPLPLLAALGATRMQRRRERLASDVALARSSRARKLARRHLAAAAKARAAGRGEAFYAEVSRALRQYVGDKLNASATGMTHAELSERVQAAGVPAESAARLVALLERCDAARFAPGSMGGERLRETLAEAESLVVALDGTWGRRANAITPPALAILAPLVMGTWLALGCGWAGAAGADSQGLQSSSLGTAGPDWTPPAELLHRGHAAYEAGRFEEAVAAYRAAERAGVRNGPLYYDLGNAYFKSGRLGQAIACYRRAETLAPRDRMLRANLEYVLARREDKPVPTRDVPVVGWVRALFRWLSLNEWLALAGILYAILCGTWIVRTLPGRRAAATTWILRGCGALLALVLVFAAFKVHAARGVHRGVIGEARVIVMSGPGSDYTTEFSLHEGAEVRIESRRAGWLLVSLSEKLRGWVPEASVLAI
jgi:tetratricopeptide (TPR) repeat protein